jgi:hypothetical protein
VTRTGVPAAYHDGVDDDRSFDQWVVDEGGPEAVVAMVEDVRHQVDEGLLQGFTDKDEYLNRPGIRGGSIPWK